MVKTERERALALGRRRAVLTTRELAQAGIHSQVVTRMLRDGELQRIARGQYRRPAVPVTEQHGLAIAARAAPRGVICLLSALSFHGIGTQLPRQVSVAVERRARRPVLAWPPLTVFRFGGRAFSEGVEVHRIEGHPVRVYSIAKSLADLFKYRRKLGMDVVLEALREAWRDRRFQMDDLDRFARVCRVERVMKPYLELLVS